MSEETNSAVPWSFWLIAAAALLWNLGGVMAYIAEFDLAALDEADRLFVELRPPWATAAFAIAVWGGTLGCVLLLLRKSIAFYVFVASFAGVIAHMDYNLFIAESTEVYGPADQVLLVGIPAIAIFLIWYARFATKKGWLN